MSELFYRSVVYYNHYYLDFFNGLSEDVQLKFNWTLQLIATQARVSEKFLKHLSGTNGLYEIRIEYESSQYRIFSFFDDDKLIVLINGFKKKTNKTPKREINQAEKIKKEYFYEKANT